mmetsp:Transcript_41981/g.96397  ORF Transcript_41981/g.96397 Transcript_41981/m.96397 type:complete len:233 (-) Transcript_41981:285-983(-)
MAQLRRFPPQEVCRPLLQTEAWVAAALLRMLHRHTWWMLIGMDWTWLGMQPQHRSRPSLNRSLRLAGVALTYHDERCMRENHSSKKTSMSWTMTPCDRQSGIGIDKLHNCKAKLLNSLRQCMQALQLHNSQRSETFGHDALLSRRHPVGSHPSRPCSNLHIHQEALRQPPTPSQLPVQLHRREPPPPQGLQRRASQTSLQAAVAPLLQDPDKSHLNRQSRTRLVCCSRRLPR